MWLIDLYIIVVGLVFGSFFNVVALRLVQRKSIAYPPSHCPHCRHRLAIMDLIPVVSYVCLRGRCRYCSQTLSVLYPFGEVATVISFYTSYVVLGWQWELLVAVTLASILVVAMIMDVHRTLILDLVTIPSIVIMLLLRFWIGSEPWSFYFIGGVVGFGLLLFISWVSKGGIGGGDIKLYAAIGVALGPWLVLFSFFFACFVGAVIGGGLLGMGKVKRKQFIPFGPFIWIGSMVAFLAGEVLWGWYIRLW